jgi:tetratricopeptide (TPR) repeat protein
MAALFISHASADDAFVRRLRTALAEFDADGWIDSRELRGGDPLWSEIQQAIDAASAFVVVVSPNALQSKYVGKELTYAIAQQSHRGKDRFPVVALALDDTRLGVLEQFFGEEPLYIPVRSGAGGIEAAIDPLLAAIGRRLPSDPPPLPQPKAEPLEDLVLELSDLKFHEADNLRRASARARLVYTPATAGKPPVHSLQSWRLIAPIGPIEAEEMRWYLEKYAIWPSRHFAERARRVEAGLADWGQQLHRAAMPPEHRENVMQAWARIDAQASRRFSVHVDAALEAGASDAAQREAQEAATQLLGLPWELLHDGKRFLFQGAQPVRVRRRLPGIEAFDVPMVATPIRILLVTARPEDDACGYIDHRISALPLVEAMEALPGQVELDLLNPPTLEALADALEQARAARRPYHVVHFDGHGVYDRRVGLGGLCFEAVEESGKLDRRAHTVVYTRDLGPLLHQHRIPLVFLEACQSAQAEQASESVASELLKVGVASVVAMSHSVLVETARRFVGAFYAALAAGRRVGDAMLAGQNALHRDSFRGTIFRVGDLRLQDWFVPVLYQEKDDPQLFARTASRQTREDFQAALRRRLGKLPEIPATGFVGRSRELLALQRLLHRERYAVIRGQGGEGKTTLAAEFARWMVRSQQMQRAAFVSVEGLQRDIAEVVLDQLGDQLIKPGFSTRADCGGDVGQALQHIERALRERRTLLVLDNMESVLLPPYLAAQTPDLLTAEMRDELGRLLDLAARLNTIGDTRLIFTSREPLPAPFDAPRHLRELQRLHPDDAVKLVERTLNAEDGAGGDAGVSDATREQIHALVDAVHGHARTLALLAPALRAQGVEATRHSLAALMAEMEQRFPGSREQSVFAGVELSLRRLSPENRERVQVLGVFHGSVDLDMLAQMMEWDKADVLSLAEALVLTGLATRNDYDHLSLNAALCPYLRARLDAEAVETLTARWAAAMLAYVDFLVKEQSKRTQLAATLTRLEVFNLLALLDWIQRHGEADSTINLCTALFRLLQGTGGAALLPRLAQARDSAAAALGNDWSHARFQAMQTPIEQSLAQRKMREALARAQALWQRAHAAGEQAYPDADYDIAVAEFLLARALRMSGHAEAALPLKEKAQKRFEAIETDRPGRGANCLVALGRYEEAARAYEQSIKCAKWLQQDRNVAVGTFQLGAVRLWQGRYNDALSAYEEALAAFAAMEETGSVATVWHQIGIVHEKTNRADYAEEAYRKALAFQAQIGDFAGQASTLGQLGTLYARVLNRPEDAIALHRQAADIAYKDNNLAVEGLHRSNLGLTLRRLGRLDEAREEIQRAIECDSQLGHAAQPWKTWAILSEIESQAKNPAAAADAHRRAIASYLAYRRDGGENQLPSGRLAQAVAQALLAGDTSGVGPSLQAIAEDTQASHLHAFVAALQAVVAGSRDPEIASSLDWDEAAEIVLLIEALEQHAH